MRLQTITAPAPSAAGTSPTGSPAADRPGWVQTHRRYALVHAVAADVARSGPAAITDRQADIDAEFGGLGPLLADAQRRCHQVFDAHLDAVLADVPADASRAVAQLTRDVAAAEPDLHALLAAHPDHPAVQDIRTHHRLTLLTTLGVDEAGVPAPTR